MIFFDANACRFKNNAYLCIAIAKIAQLVEHNLAKVGVAGSSPVFRSRTLKYVQNRKYRRFDTHSNAKIAQLVELSYFRDCDAKVGIIFESASICIKKNQ